jgi:ribokinase
MNKVVVCGSINMDIVVQSARRPAKGETILGADVSLLPGGKGLNQAVAAARLGAETEMLGAIGDDSFGRSLRGVLAANRIGARLQQIVGATTGIAVIEVSAGDNAITVASGANARLVPSMVRRVPRQGEIWVAQFETPLATTAAVFRKVRKAGARTVLNMAPMAPFPPTLLSLVDIAVVNEIELAQATGVALTERSARSKIVAACRLLLKRGPGTVIATLGAKGAVVVSREEVTALGAFSVRAVDTTGAGDCFVGALAARLAAGADLIEAARYATAAASCSIMKLGAAPSMPTPRQVARLINLAGRSSRGAGRRAP